jgi:hypothetical protein
LNIPEQSGLHIHHPDFFHILPFFTILQSTIFFHIIAFLPPNATPMDHHDRNHGYSQWTSPNGMETPKTEDNNRTNKIEQTCTTISTIPRIEPTLFFPSNIIFQNTN